MQQDTEKLLSKCNAGIKMGIDALDDLGKHAKNTTLRQVIEQSKSEHLRMADALKNKQNAAHSPASDPPLWTRLVSSLKTNVRLLADASDNTVAELLSDGCHRGIKTLEKYKHRYAGASLDAVETTDDVIRLEASLLKDVSPFL